MSDHFLDRDGQSVTYERFLELRADENYREVAQTFMVYPDIRRTYVIITSWTGIAGALYESVTVCATIDPFPISVWASEKEAAEGHHGLVKLITDDIHHPAFITSVFRSTE